MTLYAALQRRAASLNVCRLASRRRLCGPARSWRLRASPIGWPVATSDLCCGGSSLSSNAPMTSSLSSAGVPTRGVREAESRRRHLVPSEAATRQ